mgnify:CR=1 FL=1
MTNTFQKIWMPATRAHPERAAGQRGDPLPSWLHFDPLNSHAGAVRQALPGSGTSRLVATDLAGVSVSDASSP